jgi:hypothetical protein
MQIKRVDEPSFRGSVNRVQHRSPRQLTPGGCRAWLVQRPDVRAVDEVNVGLSQRGDVASPCGVAGMGGVYPGKDNDR